MQIEDFEESLMQYPDYVAHKQILLVVPPILLVVGTLGNIFSFIILMKNVKKASTYSYLSVLAVVDSLVLYVGLFRHWLGQFMINVENLNNAMCKIVIFFGYFSSDTSVWLIVAVTIERTIVVLFPLKAQIVCSARNARISIVVIVFAFICINCHFLWTVHLQQFPYNGTLISSCQAKPMFSYLIEDVWPWVDAGIYSFVPFLIIVILNCFIIKNVISAKKTRVILRQHSSLLAKRPPQRQEGEVSKKITLTLLVVSFTFLVTTLPMVAVLIYTSFAEGADDDFALTRRKLIDTVAEMLMYTNHSINFFLYCATGKKFRNQFKALIMCCKEDAIGKSSRSLSGSYRLCKGNTATEIPARNSHSDDRINL